MLYKIYRIYQKSEEERVYIGASRQKELRLCMNDHKNKSRKGGNYKKCEKLYKKMREEGEEKYEIELIEEVEVKDKDELKLRINENIRKYNSREKGYNN